MLPTIKPNEIVTVDYSAYVLRQPKRWNVVVFEPPMFTNQLWAMRVVAFPGETISVSSNGIMINGLPASLPVHVTNVSYVFAGSSAQGYVVPPGNYYVLGDNSRSAYDSRFWGSVSVTNIRGRVNGK